MALRKPKIQTAFRFDGHNVSAQTFAANQAARFVTRVSEETRQAINTAIVSSIREGITPYEISRLIRSMVGLTSPHSAAVIKYYKRQREVFSQTRAQELADKYAEKLLRSRAKTIARTEIMGALNGGALEQARQRTEAGLFTQPMKRWKITPDEVTCPVCRPLANKAVPLEAQFPSGYMAPPAHPNCRCSLSFFEAGNRIPRPAPIPPVEGRWNLQGKERQEYAAWLLANRRRR